MYEDKTLVCKECGFFFCRGSRPPRPAPGKREAFRKNVPVRTPNLHISRLFKDFLLKNIEN